MSGAENAASSAGDPASGAKDLASGAADPASSAEDPASSAEDPASGAEDLAAAARGNPATAPCATEAGVPAPSREPSVLELRYRRLLRLLPRGYREVRADEMVGTFLATMHDADPDNFDLTLTHGRPSGAEIRAVAVLAVRARWGEAGDRVGAQWERRPRRDPGARGHRHGSRWAGRARGTRGRPRCSV
jgi:hypothetical protein